MARSAVALAQSADVPAGRPPNAAVEAQLRSLGRQIGHGRKLRPGRSQAVLVLMVLLGAWLVIVYGRALTDLDAASAREAALRAESVTLEERLEARRHELELVQTDSFQRLQARAFGMGQPGEVIFSLDAGAPAAPPIVPIGGVSAQRTASTPLDSWLLILVGD